MCGMTYKWEQKTENSMSVVFSSFPFIDDMEFIKKIILDYPNMNYFLRNEMVEKKYGLTIPDTLYRKARTELEKQGLIIFHKSGDGIVEQ